MEKLKKLSDKLNLNFLLYSELFSININYFNVIIICCPPNTKLEVLKDLVSLGYKNCIIFEKPLSLDINRANEIYNIIKEKQLKSIVSFSRRFYHIPEEISLSNFEELNIKWPYIKNFKINPIIHIFPHICDYILKLCNSEEFKIINIYSNYKSNYIIQGLCNLKKINIYLYSSHNLNELVEINNIKFSWPNYIKNNRIIVEEVLNLENNNMSFLKYGINVTKVLSEIFKKFPEMIQSK